ncbi:hypothetical protein H0H93_004841, partial [Arthromyces matolae]
GDTSLSRAAYDSDEDDLIQQTWRTEAAKKQEIARLESIPEVAIGLAGLSPSLSAVFQKYYGLAAIEARVTPPAQFKKLFVQ